MIHLAILIKPNLFNIFPHQMLLPDSSEEQKQKYESSNLQAPKKEQYVEKLVTFVETEKPYLSSELTLSELSKQVKIPPHYVSQVINEHFNLNFFKLVNKYRIEEAIAIFKNTDNLDIKIIDVAYDVGFNNKVTFNKAFKAQTSFTPSQFIKELRLHR